MAGGGAHNSLKSAAHRDKSRECKRLKAKVEPLLTLGNSGEHFDLSWAGSGSDMHRDVHISQVQNALVWPLSCEMCSKPLVRLHTE